MSLPKLMTPEEVAQYLDVSIDTLNRWRANFDGPAHVKIGGRVAYPETAVADYITSQLNGTAAQAMQAALLEGRAGVREVQKQRTAEMQALDAADHIPQDQQTVAGVTPLTMGVVGASGNFERHSTVPGMQTFDNRPTGVAVDNARNGQIPVPK